MHSKTQPQPPDSLDENGHPKDPTILNLEFVAYHNALIRFNRRPRPTPTLILIVSILTLFAVHFVITH